VFLTLTGSSAHDDASAERTPQEATR